MGIGGENSDLTIGKMENTAAIVGTQGNGKIQIDRYIGKNVENHEDLTTKGGSIGTGGVGIQYSDAEKEGITRNTVVGNVEIAKATQELQDMRSVIQNTNAKLRE